jgi:hypothetical protein
MSAEGERICQDLLYSEVGYHCVFFERKMEVGFVVALSSRTGF